MIRLKIIHKLYICISVLSLILFAEFVLRPGSPPRHLFKEDEAIVSCLVSKKTPQQIFKLPVKTP